MSVNIETQMFIDVGRTDQLIANLDIELTRMPCDFITIDSQDVIGTHEINTKGEVIMKRTLQGNVIDTYTHSDNVDLPRARQAFIDGEGCHLKGYLLLSKAPGNFHISAHQYANHLIQVLPYAGLVTIDLSHKINHLSFGNQMELQIIKSKFGQGVLNPLDGITRTKHSEIKTLPIMHQYHLSIVPTTYVDDKEEYYVNQFTANTNEGATDSMPAIYFRYELSPVTVQFTKYYETTWHFLVELCAILGGVFTISGLLDSFIYAYLPKSSNQVLN